MRERENGGRETTERMEGEREWRETTERMEREKKESEREILRGRSYRTRSKMSCTWIRREESIQERERERES